MAEEKVKTNEGQENPKQLVSRQDSVSEQAEEKGYKINPVIKAYEVVLNGENLGGKGEDGNLFYEGDTYYNVAQEALDQKDYEGNNYLV